MNDLTSFFERVLGDQAFVAERIAATRPSARPSNPGLRQLEAVRHEPTRFAAVITSGYVTEDLQRSAGVREVLLEEYTLERLAGLVDRILAGSD